MSEATTTTGLQEAMSSVTSWRQEAESRLTSRLEAIDREEQRLKEALSQLQAEIAELDTLRASIRAENGGLERAQQEKAHNAMLQGLGNDRDTLASRSVELAAAHEASQAGLKAELADPEIAGLITEYERFSEAEATLTALPESYRHAILAHHETVKTRLQPIFARVQAAGPDLEAAPAALSVVASLENDEDGAPESLTFVLPVDSAVYSRWSDRDEDLPTRLGYRAVAMAAGLAKSLGAPAAPLTCRDHEGFLTVNLWLGDGEVSGDIKAAADAAAAAAFAGADQLTAAKLSASLEWLAPEVLDPPEDDETAAAVRIATPTAEA